MLISMIPEKAQIMAIISNTESFSFSQKYPRIAVQKGFELKMIKKTLSGTYCIAKAKQANPTVPMIHLIPRIVYNSRGISEKKRYPRICTSIADPQRLNNDLKKENSKGGTCLLVRRSLVITWRTV